MFFGRRSKGHEAVCTSWTTALRVVSLTVGIGVGLVTHTGEAQTFPPWGKVDTVTSGSSDDFNPVIVHASGMSGSAYGIWMLFERRTGTESQIVSRRFDLSAAAWDTVDEIVSRAPSATPQARPAFATLSYYSGVAGQQILRIAVWQWWKDGRWQLYFSTRNDSSGFWSQPLLLVQDSVDNTDARVQAFSDTTFQVVWKRGSAIMGVRKWPVTSTPPETLGVSSSSAFEFDLSARYVSSVTLVWTSVVNDTSMAVWRTLASPLANSVGPETLRTQWPCYNPHLFTGYYPEPEILYESPVGGSRQLICSLGPSWNGYFGSGPVTSDPGADHLNGRAHLLPYVTKPGSSSRSLMLPVDILVYEMVRPGDSALVFANNYSAVDTVRSPGHNRNVCLGSQIVLSPQSGYSLLAVWESNRAGRSHIYSRLVPFYIDAIAPNPAPTTALRLMQNYPNPFNPVTTITYVLPRSVHATLSVYNTLGQLVATLVDAVQDAGEHTVRLDGTALASGVYFYRLRAGDALQTRRLVLLR